MIDISTLKMELIPDKTHQIMNSMTPVYSLAITIKKMVDNESGSKSVNAYRDYSRLPELKLEEV